VLIKLTGKALENRTWTFTKGVVSVLIPPCFKAITNTLHFDAWLHEKKTKFSRIFDVEVQVCDPCQFAMIQSVYEKDFKFDKLLINILEPRDNLTTRFS